MKKNDIYLVGIILIIAIGAFIIINATKKDGDKVIIEVDNKVYKELPLDVDTTFEVVTSAGGTNTIVIENGHVDVIDANCPDKLCVDQKNAEYNGESIICLPNRVVVKVQSSKESSVDSIAN